MLKVLFIGDYIQAERDQALIRFISSSSQHKDSRKSLCISGSCHSNSMCHLCMASSFMPIALRIFTHFSLFVLQLDKKWPKGGKSEIYLAHLSGKRTVLFLVTASARLYFDQNVLNKAKQFLSAPGD